MALFGKPSAADDQRAERAKIWVQQRSPFSIISVMFGVLAVLDFFTGVVGAAFAVAAIALALIGLNDLTRRPQMLGRRLCITGLVLGVLGLVLCIAFYL